MTTPATTPAGRVCVRPLGPDFGFADIVVDGWSIGGIRLRRGTDGAVRVEWPTTEARDGRRFPLVSPPVHLRESLERQLAGAFANALDDPRGGRR